MKTRTRTQTFTALAAGLSLTSIAAAADEQVSAKPDPARAFGSVTAPVRPDRPAITDEEIVAAKRVGQELLLTAAIQRGPDVIRGETPNFYLVRGREVPMRLRSDEIGVMTTAGDGPENVIAVAAAAARAAGLMLAPTGHSAVNNWARLKLAAPIGDAPQVSALIDKLVVVPGVRMASPVFENAFIDGGYYMPTDRVMIQFKDGIDAATAVKSIAPDFEVVNPALGKMPGAMTLRFTERNGFAALRRANELFDSGMLRWSSPSALQTLDLHVLTPNDPTFLNLQWAHRNTGQDFTDGNGVVYNGVADRDMDTDQAWDITTGRSTVRVLVMDSGVQTTHPDLRFSSGRDFTTGAVLGVGDGSPGNSCDNHGTAVAGCAANIINNSREQAGTAGDCSIMSAKIADQQTAPCSSSFASYAPEWVVNALDWGRDNGAKVTNASFGVGQDNAIEAMYSSTWTSGLLHFASAGNGGSDGIGDNGSGFPGSAPFTISVSALDPDGTLTRFSNYGTNCDLCTGGIFILAADRTGSAGYTSGDNVYFSGTSAASPLAAGVGLLFFSQHGFATPSQARTAIFNSCVDLGAAGIDTFYNRGFINAYAALIENAPSNDSCTSPMIINPNGGNLVFRWIMDTTWATPSRLEPDETCTGGVNNTVFFRFTADHTGVATIHTSGSAYDTVLSVFSGCPTFDSNGNRTSSPTPLACNDDYNGTNQSQVTLNLTHGQTILIKVSKFGATSAGDTLDFNLAFNPTPPPNDSCATPTVIADAESGVVTFNETLDTYFASESSCEVDETCGAAINTHSVFYRFTPQHDGTIDVNTIGTNYDTVLSVHSGCSLLIPRPPNPAVCVQPSHLACNDDWNGTLQSNILDFPVSAGNNYYIKVARYGNTGAAGILDFNFRYDPASPGGDSCSTTVVIPGNNLPGNVVNYNPAPRDIYYATAGTCDPDLGCIRGFETLYHSVWYSFTPQLPGAINVNTVGSNFDSVLQIRSGCPTPFISPNGTICLNNGAELACNDDINANSPPGGLLSQILGMRVNPGQTYSIMVASKVPFTPSYGGSLDFNLQYAANACVADRDDGSGTGTPDGAVTLEDLLFFISRYESGVIAADVDDGSGTGTPDGAVTLEDLLFYLARYEAGC